MRFKLTILLLVLNAALLAYIFYFNKVQSTRTLFDAANRLILSPDFVQDIDQIKFSSTHIDEPWILSKTDDHWLVDSPVQWKANPFAIQQLVFQLRRLSWESRFSVKDVRASGRSLQSYNLENPPIRIDLHNNGVSLSLALGAPTEIGNRLYLLSPDGEFIYVVNRSLLDIMQRDLEAFLDRRVFGMAARSIRGVQIQNQATSRVRLERSEARWEFVSPIATQADGDRVEAFVQSWQSVEVETFETDPDRLEMFEGETVKLTLEGMGQRETLHLISREEEEGSYLAKHEDFPAIFSIDAGLVEGLRNIQEDLRERRVLSEFSGDWTSLEMQFGRLNVTLQQLENGEWQVLHTDDEGQLRSAPAALEAIVSLQNMLSAMEADRFVSDAPSEADLIRYGLDEPQRKVTLRMPSTSLVEFEVGGPYQNTTFLCARTNRSNSVFLVRPYVLGALTLDPLHYRDRVIRDLPDSVLLEDVALIDRASGTSLLDQDRDEDLLERIADYLRTTRVDRYYKREFSDPLPLDSTENIEWLYLMEARIVYPSSPSETDEFVRLFLTSRIGGITQYIGDPSTGLVGTLPMPLLDALDPVLSQNPEEPETPVEELVAEPDSVPNP